MTISCVGGDFWEVFKTRSWSNLLHYLFYSIYILPYYSVMEKTKWCCICRSSLSVPHLRLSLHVLPDISLCLINAPLTTVTYALVVLLARVCNLRRTMCSAHTHIHVSVYPQLKLSVSYTCFLNLSYKVPHRVWTKWCCWSNCAYFQKGVSDFIIYTYTHTHMHTLSL